MKCPPCTQDWRCRQGRCQERTVSVVFDREPSWLGLLGVLVIVIIVDTYERIAEWITQQ